MNQPIPEELQQLLDRQRIQDVLTSYSRAVDRADLELLRTCYHDDATEDHGGVFSGSAADYLTMIGPMLPRAGILNHLVANVLVEFLTKDSARVEAYILTFARMKKDGEKFDTLTLARSVDRFEKRSGRWAIAARRLCWEWNQDLPMREGWGRGLIAADASQLVRGAKRPNDILYPRLNGLRHMEIKGSIALVTGGNRGIGEAFVRVLLAAGATKVYAGSRDPAAAAALAAEFPGRCIAIELDVTDEREVAASAVQCGDTNLLVNNAGFFANKLLIGSDSMAAAREEMEVNYFGTLAMCRAFAPVLARNGGGAIVNVLSAAAIVSLPIMGGYGPSKSAARSLSTAVRAELAEQGTHVSALIVGSVDTRMAAHVEGAKESPEDIARAGLRAVKHGIDELDTDRMAVEVRAALALDPKALERRMAKMLKSPVVRTGK